MTETHTLPTLYRELVLDADALRAAREAGDERIPMSLSSEYAVERGGFFEEPYLEVLDHTEGAVDLSRTEGGLPLLLDHDPRQQIGVVEDVRIEGGKLRGLARFSRSAKAQEVRQDVLDGIRTRTSIGYRVKALVQESRASKDAPATYRATAWQLYENSIVSIPADPTVGVGRAVPSDAAGEAAHPVSIRHLAPEPAPAARSHPVSEQNTAAPVAATPAPAVGSADREAAQRAQQVIDLCTLAGFPERIADYLHAERAIADIRAELMRDKAAKAGAVAPAVMDTQAADPYRDGTHTFSIVRAINAAKAGDWSKAGYERAVSDAEAKRLGRDANALTFLVPTALGQRTTISAGGSTTGSKTVFTEPQSLIEILRNKSGVMRAGATVLSGLQGNVAFPRQSGAGTAYWMGEASGTDVTESNQTFDQVTLSPKTLMGRQSYSNQLLVQSNINVEQQVRSDLAAVLALELDRAAIHGSGASNQPTGLYGISGVGAEAFGGTVTYAHLVNMALAAAAANADVNEMAFLVTPETAAKALQVARFSSTDTPLYQGTFSEGTLIGYRAIVTNQLSKVLGVGTNEHAIVLGAWPQFLIGEWGALEVKVDPYTLMGSDAVRVIARLFVDFNVRHAASFTKGTGLVP